MGTLEGDVICCDVDGVEFDVPIYLRRFVEASLDLLAFLSVLFKAPAQELAGVLPAIQGMEAWSSMLLSMLSAPTVGSFLSS